MKHKRALLVIGGKQGIGEEVVKQACEQDDHWSRVFAVDQKVIDVRDQRHCRDAAYELAMGSQHLDIAFCAGINKLGAIGDLDSEDVMEHYRVNVGGFINVLDAFKRCYGHRQVNVTAIVSDSSRIPMRGSIMYASSKAALAHAIRCAARELAPNWRVNGVSPGVVDDTPMTEMVDEIVPALRGWTLEEAQSYERSLVPMGRRAYKSEVAEAVLWSLRGPEFMTGSIIDVTGGK